MPIFEITNGFEADCELCQDAERARRTWTRAEKKLERRKRRVRDFDDGELAF